MFIVDTNKLSGRVIIVYAAFQRLLVIIILLFPWTQFQKWVFMPFFILLLLNLHLNYLLSVIGGEKALLTDLIFSLVHALRDSGHLDLA